MLEDLQWPSLQSQRYVTKLKLFYNIVNSSSVLSIANYFTNTTYPTRHHHPFHFEIPFARTDHSAFTPNLSVIGTIYLLTLLNPNFYNCF